MPQQSSIDFAKLAEQQKNQRANKYKIKVIKQTHDEEIAENFSLITETFE